MGRKKASRQYEEVILRLKADALGEEWTRDLYRQGYEAGEKWARYKASKDQLERLYKEDFQADTAFWEQVDGNAEVELIGDKDYASGFVYGASDVWENIVEFV